MLPLISTSVSTPTLDTSHKTMTVYRGAHKIRLREISGILIHKQVSSQLEVGSWILAFRR
jgi:hypothetical protein